jgi:hypothetical protein
MSVPLRNPNTGPEVKCPRGAQPSEDTEHQKPDASRAQPRLAIARGRTLEQDFGL